MTYSFLEPGRGKDNQAWRYALTIFTVIWASLLGGLIVVLVAFIFEGSLEIESYAPITVLLISMLPFLVVLLTLWGCLRLLHKRGVMSLVRPTGTFSWQKILLSAGLWFLLAALSDLVLAVLNPLNYQWSFDAKSFFLFLLPALILVPIQTSTEELIFRGYLIQWMGRYSRKMWLPLLAPSVVFMLMHFLNPEVEAYGFWLTMPMYFGIGLLMSWITLKTGGLEMALGLHLANNLYASLIVTFPSTALPSPALFSIQTYEPVAALVQQVTVMAVYLGIIYLVKREWMREGEAPAGPVSEIQPGS